MTVNLDGIFVPVITPFEEDGRLSLSLLENNIRKLNDTGVAGYMPLGSNGEFFMMSEEEQLEVMKTAVQASEGKKVFAGAGRESLYETEKCIEKMAGLGIDAVFLLTPHYFPKQMSQECLTEYYLEAADVSPVPVLLYSAPGYAAGVQLEPETVRRLGAHENIIGLKDTSPLEIREYTEAVKGENCGILAGTFGKFVKGMAQGAVGGVLSSANYIPEICCQLYQLCKDGEYEKAEKIHKKLEALAKGTTAPYGVAGVKAAMNFLGYSCGSPRKPLKPVPTEDREEFEKRLKAGLEAVLQEV